MIDFIGSLIGIVVGLWLIAMGISMMFLIFGFIFSIFRSIFGERDSVLTDNECSKNDKTKNKENQEKSCEKCVWSMTRNEASARGFPGVRFDAYDLYCRESSGMCAYSFAERCQYYELRNNK